MGSSDSCLCACGAPRLPEESDQGLAARPPPSADVDVLYSWISAEEQLQIHKIREALSPLEQQQLAAAPEDIRHDLMLCRFLRGHDWELSSAIKALREHLNFRCEFRETIERARARLPTGTVDYNAERVLHAEEMQNRFVTLQLPAHTGTNDGMPVSLFVARFMDLSDLGSFPENQLVEWFVSCLEQRNLTLHNQSVRTRKMARVLEARDMMGFSLSQLFARPGVLRKVARVFKNGAMYPELMGRFFMFNLEPGGRAIKLIKSIVPARFADKVMYAECGDWMACFCSATVLSPAVLPAWVEYMRKGDGEDADVLTTARPRCWRVVTVGPADEFEWEICFKGIGAHQVSIRVSVWLFGAGSLAFPLASECCAPRVLQVFPGSSAFASDKLKFSYGGFALLEAELQGKSSARVAMAIFPAGSGQGVSATTFSEPVTAKVFKDVKPMAQSAYRALGPSLMWLLGTLVFCAISYVLLPHADVFRS